MSERVKKFWKQLDDFFNLTSRFGCDEKWYIYELGYATVDKLRHHLQPMSRNTLPQYAGNEDLWQQIDEVIEEASSHEDWLPEWIKKLDLIRHRRLTLKG